MTNYLVVTAMGDDRPGIVSQLAKVASDCDCDIVDSRMAIFGNEFTLIMMLSGAWPAITLLETSLSSVSMELGLLTVMKRTSKHTPQNFMSRIEVNFEGKNQRGTMRQITEFLASQSLDLAAVRSHAEENSNAEQIQSVYFAINIPENADLDGLEQGIHDLANTMSLNCHIKLMLNTALID